MKCGRNFDGKIRIWETLRWLRDATVSKIPVMPLHFDGRGMQRYRDTSYQGEYVESVEVSPSLSKLAISAIDDLDVYVTAMEFIFDDGGPNVRTGKTAAPGMVVLLMAGSLLYMPDTSPTSIIRVSRLR